MGGREKSKCMLRFSEEFLEVSTSKFTHRVHEVNDRTVVTLNDDTRWAVMWKVSCGHKNGVGSAYCFSVGGIRTGEKRDGKGVQESKTLSSRVSTKQCRSHQLDVHGKPRHQTE